MRVGQRVWCKLDESPDVQGVIIATQFDGTLSRQECHVLWDNGTMNWEMGEDLKSVPNIPGDSFKTSGNGFGVRVGDNSPENSPVDTIKASRQSAAESSDGMVAFLRSCGIVPKTKRNHVESVERQLTLDIREKIRHGAPVKGGANGRAVDPRRESLAKAAASGEPMLVHQGAMKVACTIKPFQTDTGIAGRVINQANKPRTKAEKRKAAERKNKV